MKRDTRDAFRIIVAVVVLAGLVGFVAWKRKRTAESNEAEEKSKKLITLDLASVAKVEIANKDGKIVVVRRPKEAGKYADKWAPLSDEFDSVPEWQIVEPYNSLPDYYSMTTLFDNIRDLSYEKVISEKSDQSADFGLETPKARIVLYEKAKTEPSLIVQVGEQNSAATGVYLKISTDPRILLGTNSLDYLKSRHPREWRKKEIVGLKDLGKVQRVDLTYDDKGGKWKLAAGRSQGTWAIQEPQKLPADGSKVENFLSNLKSLRANDVVSDDAEKDAKKYGLEHPYASLNVTFEPEGGGSAQRTVLIGNKFDGDKDIYVRRSDYPQVFTVRSSLKSSLTQRVVDFVDKRAFRLNKDSVAQLSAERTSGTIEAKKEGKNWMLVKPVADAADGKNMSTLLSKLMEWKGEEYLGEKVPADAGKRLLFLRLSEGAKTEELSLYEFGEKAKGPVGKVGNLFFRFDKSTYNEVVRTLDDLRDRRILPVERTDLSSITLKRGETVASFSRTEEGKWILGKLEGAKPELKVKLREGTAAESILLAAEMLRIDTFLQGRKVDEGKPESLSLEFRPKEGDPIAWVIGGKEGDKRLLRSVKRGVVGSVDAGRVEEIEKVLNVEAKEKG